MKLNYNNYEVVVNNYSWDLYFKSEYTNEDVNKAMEKDGVCNFKKGDFKPPVHIGFYTNVASLLDQVLRMEMALGNDVANITAISQEVKRFINEFTITMEAYVNEAMKRNVEKQIAYTKNKLIDI